MATRKRKWAVPTKRAKPSGCRALVLGNAAKLRQDLLDRYERRRKALEKAKGRLSASGNGDEQAFRLWCGQELGAEISETRELQRQHDAKAAQLDRIFALADLCLLSPRRLCLELLYDVDTSGRDFWTLLQERLDGMLAERMRVRDGQCESGGHGADPFSGFGGMDGEFDRTDDDGEGSAFDEFESLFEDMMEEFVPGFKGLLLKPDDNPDGDELKRLYRDLCHRHHPDKDRTFDAKAKELWLSIQSAYQGQRPRSAKSHPQRTGA